MYYLLKKKTVAGFDLNVRLEEPEDDDSVDEVHLDEPRLENESGFDLNLPQVEHAVEAPVEGDNDNDVHVDDEPQDNHGVDLNIPLDEFGAVDFSYIGNDAEPVEHPHRRKEMTEHLRKQVYQSLLARSNNGKLGKKDTTIVAEQFGLHIRAVQRLWKRGLDVSHLFIMNRL